MNIEKSIGGLTVATGPPRALKFGVSCAARASTVVHAWATIAIVFNALPACSAEVSLVEVARESSRRDSQIEEVRSVRRYILHNSRWSDDAVADVLVIVKSDRADYLVLKSTAKGLRKEILKRIMDGEAEALQKRQAEVTPSNYDATSGGTRTVNGQICDALQLIPKRKSKYVVDGWACADPKEKALIHLEGQTAGSVSFWVGKVHISQDFRKIGPYWYSSFSKSTADVKLLGTTELTIEYLDYRITPKEGPALIACRTGGCSPLLNTMHVPQTSSAHGSRMHVATFDDTPSGVDWQTDRPSYIARSINRRNDLDDLTALLSGN